MDHVLDDRSLASEERSHGSPLTNQRFCPTRAMSTSSASRRPSCPRRETPRQKLGNLPADQRRGQRREAPCAGGIECVPWRRFGVCSVLLLRANMAPKTMPNNEFSALAMSLPGATALALFLLGVSSCGAPEPRQEAAAATDSTAAAEAAWATVQAVNRAWAVQRSLDSLRPHIHPRFVGIYPGGERLEGQEAVLASYAGFLGAATVNWLREERPTIQVYGNGRFAVITYVYDMEYVQGGRTIPTSGHDMYVLVREGERWLVVAQQFQPLPGRPL